MRYYSGGSRISPSQAVGILVFLILTGYIVWFNVNTGLWSKIWIVMEYNWSFWVAFIGLPVAVAVWRRIKNPEGLTLAEAFILAQVTALALMLNYAVFYYSATEMADNEVWNGYVLQSIHEEAHDTETTYQECTGYDSKGNCTGYTTRRVCTTTPPSWYVRTNNDDDRSVGISRTQYAAYIARFSNSREQFLGSQGDACNGNPGRIYGIAYDNIADHIVPTAVPHRFVNYVRGSAGTIMKRGESNMKGFERFLLPYPNVQEGTYGPIEISRVLDAKANVPTEWKARIDRDLDVLLTTRGKAKQVNCMVYIVGTQDQAFIHALESRWIYGKKNDFIVVIGASNWPRIDWVNVMAFWTDVPEFNIQLRDNIFNLKTLEGKEEVLIGLIGTQIDKRPESGGWRRKPMAEYAYLAGDIELPWWAHLCVLLIAGLIAAATAWALENNEIREWRAAAADRINSRFGAGRN